MDLRTLHYFITVLEAGSLSRAAEALYRIDPVRIPANVTGDCA